MDIKTRDDLRASLLQSYAALVDLDVETSGSVERDIFVEAPIEGQLIDIWNSLGYLQKLQSPIMYETDLLDTDKDTWCRGYGVGDISATYATGAVTLFTEVKPTSDIYVDSSFKVTTVDGSVSFAIVGYYTLPVSLADNYFNALTGRYELSVQIISLVGGTAGNIGSSRITKLSQPITGISGCTNNAPTSGGEPAGTISQRVAAVKQKQRGRTLGNTQGIINFVQNYATSVSVVGSKDPLMVRTEGLGAGIDIYVIGSVIAGAVDTITVTSTGLLSLASSYTSTTITLSEQPVNSIAVFLKTSTGTTAAVNTNYYKLSKDTGILKNSTRAKDKLMLTSTGVSHIGPFVSGNILEVRYNYNALLHTIGDNLNSPVNSYDNRDYLLYEKATVGILTNATVKLYAGYDLTTVASAFSQSFATFLSTFSGVYVEFADVIGLIKNTAGVDNIDLPNAYISASDLRSPNANKDIPIYDREYPIVGAITFNPWTGS